MPEGSSNRRPYTSPLRLLAFIAASVFVTEALVMILLIFLPPMPHALAAPLDATLVTILMYPILYRFVVRPMTQHINERRQAEAALSRTHDELELRVQERTEELTIANAELQDEINERWRVEARLRESEEKYRTLFNSMTEGFTLNQAIYDERGQLHDLLVLDANPAAEKANGLKREDFVGKTWRQLWPGAEQYWWEICNKVFNDGKEVHFENYAAVHDRWYEVHHFPAGQDLLGSTFTDFTERKRAEETMAWLASFPEFNPNPTVEVDLAGHVYYLNPAAKRLLPDLAATSYQHPWLAGLELVGRQFQSGNMSVLTREVTLGDVSYQQDLFYVASSQRVRIYGLDITERKRAEVILRKAHEELEVRVEERTAELSHANEALRRSEEALKKLNRALRMLSECSVAQVHAEDEPGLLVEICRLIVETGGYRMAWVGFAEQDEARRVRPVAQYGFEEGYLDRAQITWADTERGRGPTGTAIRTGVTQVNQDFLTNPSMAPWRESALRQGYQSSIALPLKDEESTFGALTIYSSSPYAFDAEEAGRLTKLANDLAFGINALRAEAAILQLSSAVEQTADTVVITDRNGLIEYVNPAFERLTGYAKEEALGKTPRILKSGVHDTQFYQEFWNTILRGEVFLGEMTNRKKNGESYHEVKTITPLRDTQGNVTHFVATGKDITEHKRAEEQIQLQIAAMEAAANGIVITDRQGHIQWTNLAFTQMSGYDLYEVLGQSTRIFKSGQHDADFYHQMWTAILSGQVWRGEMVNRRKDGSLYTEEQTIAPVRNARGDLTHFIAIKQDITPRKQAEEALRASEMRFRTVADFTYDWEYWLGPDRQPIYISPSCERVTGYSVDDFTHDLDLLERIIYPADRDLVANHTHQVLEHGQLLPVDFRIMRRDGQVRWIGHVCRPVYDEQGRALGRRISNRDITERKQAETALQEQEELYRDIFETTTDGLAINSFDGAIVAANAAFCVMHRCERHEVIGRRITSFIHPAHRYIFAECGEAVKADVSYEKQAVALRRDDTPFYVVVRGIGLTYYGQPHVLIVFRDVSQQVEAYMQLEQRVQERTHELRMLLELSQSMTRTLEMKPLVKLILDQLRSVVDYTSATIFTLSGQELVHLAHQGLSGGPDLPHPHFSITESPLGRAVMSGERPVIIPNIHDETPLAVAFQRTIGDRLDAIASEVRSWMGIPLVITDHTVGMLAVSHRQIDYYTQRHADLAMTFASQAALAIENARLYEQAQELAAIQERQRLARDLHDSVSQTLFSASLAAQVLPRLWAKQREEGQRCLDELSRLTRGALAEMRALLIELRPNVLIETKLGDLVRQLAEAITSRTRMPVQVTAEGQQVTLPPDVQVALYRIVQEALNNMAKHSGANQAMVQLRYVALDNRGSTGVELSVADDGRGFDRDAVPPDHLGLGIMRERAEAIDAALTIDSHIGQGTRVFVTWPGPNSVRDDE